MYKSEKGITFVVLVITIAILFIIGSAVAGAAISTYKDSKVKVYIEEMDLVREKLILYEDKAKLNSSIASIDTLGADISTDSALKETLISAGIDESYHIYYRYLSTSDLVSLLGVKDLKNETIKNAKNMGGIIFNINNKKLYSLEPVKYNGMYYYSPDDIRGK